MDITKLKIMIIYGIETALSILIYVPFFKGDRLGWVFVYWVCILALKYFFNIKRFNFDRLKGKNIFYHTSFVTNKDNWQQSGSIFVMLTIIVAISNYNGPLLILFSIFLTAFIISVNMVWRGTRNKIEKLKDINEFSTQLRKDNYK